MIELAAMLVRRHIAGQVVEFIEPRPGITALLWLLLCVPLLGLAVYHFTGIVGRDVTPGQLIRWHLLLWLDLGPVFWALLCQGRYGNGPLSRAVNRSLAGWAVGFPGARQQTLRIDTGRGLLTIVRKGNSEDHVLGDIERVRLGKVEPSETDKGTVKVGDVDVDVGDIRDADVSVVIKGKVVQLAVFSLYLPARQAAEAIARATGRPLENQVTDETKQVDELDVGIVHDPPAPHPGEAPSPRFKRDFRTVKNGSEIVLQYRVSLKWIPAGLLFGALLLGFAAACAVGGVESLSAGEPFKAPAVGRLLLSTFVGFFGFWQTLLVLFNWVFPSSLIISGERTRWAYRRFGLVVPLQETATAAIEEVLVEKSVGGWVTSMISDDVIVMYTIYMDQTKEESMWVAGWIRWAIGKTGKPGIGAIGDAARQQSS